MKKSDLIQTEIGKNIDTDTSIQNTPDNESISSKIKILDSIKNISAKRVTEVTQEIITICAERGFMISCAESLTGGILTSSFIEISGASKVVFNGIVAYHNDAKQLLLGVKRTTLSKCGAVSEETACEMVKGLFVSDKITYGVSTTGIAGPTGGTAKKPIGLVYIGVGKKDFVKAYGVIFMGNREQIRQQSAYYAAKLLLNYIKGDSHGR